MTEGPPQDYLPHPPWAGFLLPGPVWPDHPCLYLFALPPLPKELQQPQGALQEAGAQA